VDETKPSKSARKREYAALQKLGEELITLQERDLESLGLDEDLLEAVLEAKRLTKRGALRRQKQYIGKLMGRVDPEPIRAALARLQRK
jgi:ribosome-associated protein